MARRLCHAMQRVASPSYISSTNTLSQCRSTTDSLIPGLAHLKSRQLPWTRSGRRRRSSPGHGFFIWLGLVTEKILFLVSSEQEADDVEPPAPRWVDGQHALWWRSNPPFECGDPWWSLRLWGEWSCLPECWVLLGGPCPLFPKGLDFNVLSSWYFLF